MPDRAALSTRAVLDTAIERRVCPAAVAEVGDSRGARWTDAVGRLTFDGDAASCTADTIFDLASLTKPIATTSLIMQMVDDRRVSLDAQAVLWFAEWLGADR